MTTSRVLISGPVITVFTADRATGVVLPGVSNSMAAPMVKRRNGITGAVRPVVAVIGRWLAAVNDHGSR